MSSPRILAVCVALLSCLFSTGRVEAESLPTVPEGFSVEKVAAPPLLGYPMMGGFDDRGRLFVAASAGGNLGAEDLLDNPPNFIQMLEDVDGDGHFDKSTVFADKMTLPMGALWYRGALYVASPPSIWRLEDTDGDGIADRREEFVDRFGFTGNAASIHGCFLGPTGRIYWVDGRHGHEFIDAEGTVTSKGRAARIFSCRADGSDVEVIAGGGMDNPVEVDFLPTGEMLGTVNIMLSQPRVDTLTHWIEGGVYPRRDQEDCIAEFKLTGDLLPPVGKLGHVAVSGMTRYRSEHFGPDYRDNLFITIFNTHKLVRSQVSRSGATFESREEDFLVSDNPDFHPTDVIEDADGSLLVIDTGGWFRIGCPTSQVAKPEIQGGIYRIRRVDAPPVDDPRGLELALDRQSPEQLVRYLDDRRPAVVEKTTDELARRGEEVVASLENQFSKGNETRRLHSVWALARMDNKEARPVLRIALDDDSESVRLAACTAIGTLRDTEAVAQLVSLVTSDDMALRRESATALGRICDAKKGSATQSQRRQAIEALFASLRSASVDRFLEHALIFAVIRIDDREQTIPFLDDDSPHVRRAALIALDQMDSGHLTRELVLPLLDTDDPELQQQALTVIGKHEGWAGETRRLLGEWLSQRELDSQRESALRGFLLAQAGNDDIQQLVADALHRDSLPSAIRLLLLEVIDRAALATLPASWQTAVGKSLRSQSADARMQAVRIIQSRQMEQYDDTMRQLVESPDTPSALRIEAAIALAPRMSSVAADLFEFLLGQLSPDRLPLDRLAAARALAELPLVEGQLVSVAGKLDTAGPLALPLLVKVFARSDHEDVGLALVAALQRASASVSLSPDELSAILDRYPQSVQQAADDLLNRLGTSGTEQKERLAAIESELTGGNADRGREVFFGKKAACSSCHTVRGEGGRVGPDLSTIGNIRTPRDLLEAIVFPSASFAREFRTYTIATSSGRVHSGIIGRQTTDSIYLRTSELAEVRIPRTSIDEMQESDTSIMPKGLEQTLSPDELGDLLAYLQALK